MADRSFTKLNPSGPAETGLIRRPPYPREGLKTEPPIHSSYLYVNDEDLGIKVGVWECTPHTSTMRPFPVNEFMILLEGSVTMLEQDGRTTTVRAGEAFVVPKGVVCQWKQFEPVRKYFAIYGGDSDQTPRQDELPLSVMKAPSGTFELPTVRSTGGEGDTRFEAGHTIYTDATGTYSLGVWQAVSADSRPVISRSHQLLRIEAGSLTLSEGSTATETFEAGDTVLITPGAAISWRGSSDLRVLSCRINDHRRVAYLGAAE